MDADAERGGVSRKRNRIIERRAARHERCRAQDAVRSALFNSAVDQFMSSEIVRVQNDLLHVVFLCAFRIVCYRSYHNAFP